MTPKQTATAVGAITTFFGILLLAKPGVTRIVGLSDAEIVRVIGVSDLALVPGLIAGKPRWPWMLLRGLFNVGVAAHALGEAPTAPDPRRPRAVAVTMCALTVADLSTARALHRAGD